MARKTLAILSVSAGAGHVRCAQALETVARDEFHVEAVHIDVMDLVSSTFRKLYAESYLRVVKTNPALWSYLYDKTDQPRANTRLQRVVKAIERLNTRRFMERLREIDPDHVICTHYLPAQLLSRLIGKGRWNRPVWVQVTDFDVHALWIVDHLDGYFAASPEVAYRMVDRGLSPDRVHVTGIPVMPAFGARHDRAASAAELGLDPNRTTLLMMSGGAGVGGMPALAGRLLAMPGDFQILALAGRNEAMLAQLRAIGAGNPRLVPMGFTDKVERLMAVADLAISKPGGLSTSECLCMGLPMILVSTIPGQEERNATYLLENGAALRAYDEAGLEYRLRLLLSEPERLDAMRRNAAALGRPDAARDVLRRVLGSGA